MGQSPSTSSRLQWRRRMEPHAGHPSRSSSSCHSSLLNLSSSPHFCLLLKCQMKQHQMEASRSPAESNGRRAFPHGLCGRAAIALVANPASPPSSACSRMARRAPQTKPPGFKQKMTPEQLSRCKKRQILASFTASALLPSLGLLRICPAPLESKIWDC